MYEQTLDRSASGTRYRVLIAEDNPDDEVLTLRALSRSLLSIDSQVLHDGEQVLRHILGSKKVPAKVWPELILLDIKLPKVNGLEIIEKLKSHPEARCIPIVCLTSSEEEFHLASAYAKGVNGFIRKPTDYEQYLEVVAASADWWLRINCLPSDLESPKVAFEAGNLLAVS